MTMIRSRGFGGWVRLRPVARAPRSRSIHRKHSELVACLSEHGAMTENPGDAQPQAPRGDSDEPKIPSAPIYTAKVENLGGTSGEVRVDDGQTLPTAPTSNVDQGNNPEQFLAMAWSTCLGETLKVVLAVNELDVLSR